MDLGVLACKRCGRALGKVRAERPRGPRAAPGARACSACVARVRYDPTAPLGVAR